MRVCTNELPNVTFPSLGDLLEISNSLYRLPIIGRPDIEWSWPKMPTIPDPFFPDASRPSFEAQQTLAAMYSNIQLAIMNELISLLTQIIDVKKLIPDPIIPSLPFSFTDFLPPYKPSDLIEKLKPYIDVDFPFIPTLWLDLNDPYKKLVAMLQYIQSEVTKIILFTFPAMVDMVIGIFKKMKLPVPAIPPIPKIPTVAEIIAMLPPNQIPDHLKHLKEMIPVFETPTIASLIALIPAPFPTLDIPDPLLPDRGDPQQSILDAIQMALSDMQKFIVSLWTNFVKQLPIIGSLVMGVLPKLPDLFPLPVICIDIPIPRIFSLV